MKRVAWIVLGVAFAAAACVALIAVLASRDSSQVHGPSGPGTYEAEPGAGSPPTSGDDGGGDAPVTRDETALSDAQIVAALALGNVVITYSSATPPAALVALRDDVAGAFDRSLAEAGQAIILARHSGETQALAWQRRLVATGPDDPALREFAEAWLGQGRETS